MENVFREEIEGIMGGEGPARAWSIMRPFTRMGQILSGYLIGPVRPNRSMPFANHPKVIPNEVRRYRRA